ncbi:MAG: T9SS type A sorting domain-containing protein, partial [Chitinophagaceae bacterium]|nr:T9SS type A sorting domain-containing protein [Chitinophagaceae bacterium]
VDVNRAGIVLTGDNNTGTNKNIVVYGIRNNNVADPDPLVPTLTYNSASLQKAWQRWSYRFTANIKVQAFENILVANNRINDNITDNFQQAGYVVRDNATPVTLTGPQAVFNYTNHYGIYVNRGQSGNLNTPTTGPSLFRNGVVIRDNWVFGTMRTKIHASGQGMLIKDNVLRDLPGKSAWVDPTGVRLVGNSSTLENRGIDWGGHDVVVSGNDIQVSRHKLKTTIYSSVDGEGILIQECCGGTTVRGVSITDNTVNSYIGIYKMKDIEDVDISNNTLTNGTSALNDLVYVSANANVGNFYAKNVKVSNNSTANGNISLYASGSGGGTGNSITGNQSSTSGAAIRFSCAANPSVSGNSGFSISSCLSSSARVASEVQEEAEIEALEQGLSIYPQPANRTLNIDMNAEKKSEVSIEVLNLLGQQVLTQKASLVPGKNHLKIAVGSINNGQYILRIKSESSSVTRQLLLNR